MHENELPIGNEQAHQMDFRQLHPHVGFIGADSGALAGS
jgi:hypothetical protein